MAKIATLQEIETHWSLVDVVNANALLDCQALAEWQAAQKVPR